jgi:hypothetical protein
VIIAPINVLGEQTAVLLARAGVEMTINGETTTSTDFLVSAMSYRHDSPYLLISKATRF